MGVHMTFKQFVKLCSFVTCVADGVKHPCTMKRGYNTYTLESIENITAIIKCDHKGTVLILNKVTGDAPFHFQSMKIAEPAYYDLTVLMHTAVLHMHRMVGIPFNSYNDAVSNTK